MPRSILDRINIQTGDRKLLDITQRGEEIGRESGMVNDRVFGSTLHTTTALTINEGREDLDDGLLGWVRELVPAVRL